ncbi:sigma-70 family RNA polymerase sigma factor [candidate division KSB1 bacterium]|nr:sigma-70 family RNA polymerase sigma factor [candidate division KSB1 bacterium]
MHSLHEYIVLKYNKLKEASVLLKNTDVSRLEIIMEPHVGKNVDHTNQEFSDMVISNFFQTEQVVREIVKELEPDRTHFKFTKVDVETFLRFDLNRIRNIDVLGLPLQLFRGKVKEILSDYVSEQTLIDFLAGRRTLSVPHQNLLYEKMQSYLYNFFLSKFHKETFLAEEIIQMAWVKIISKIDQFAHRSSFRVWCCQIVYFTYLQYIRDNLRRRKLTVSLFSEDTNQDAVPLIEKLFDSKAGDVAEQVIHSIILEIVNTELDGFFDDPVERKMMRKIVIDDAQILTVAQEYHVESQHLYYLRNKFRKYCQEILPIGDKDGR